MRSFPCTAFGTPEFLSLHFARPSRSKVRKGRRATHGKEPRLHRKGLECDHLECSAASRSFLPTLSKPSQCECWGPGFFAIHCHPIPSYKPRRSACDLLLARFAGEDRLQAMSTEHLLGDIGLILDAIPGNDDAKRKESVCPLAQQEANKLTRVQG